jgi:uncharacterized protein YjlB
VQARDDGGQSRGDWAKRPEQKGHEKQWKESIYQVHHVKYRVADTLQVLRNQNFLAKAKETATEDRLLLLENAKLRTVVLRPRILA